MSRAARSAFSSFQWKALWLENSAGLGTPIANARRMRGKDWLIHMFPKSETYPKIDCVSAQIVLFRGVSPASAGFRRASRSSGNDGVSDDDDDRWWRHESRHALGETAEDWEHLGTYDQLGMLIEIVPGTPREMKISVSWIVAVRAKMRQQATFPGNAEAGRGPAGHSSNTWNWV